MTRLISGARLEVFERLDSTMNEARRRFAAGRRDDVFILALEQTAGYGRRGSAWMQRAGDFAGTLVFSEKVASVELGQLSFVAALAAEEAILCFAPKAEIRLKWPNDVLIGGGKAAGLLLELFEAGDDGAVLSLGVGVNIVSKPEGVDYPTARLLDAPGATAPTPQAFAAAFDESFLSLRTGWRRDGFEPVRAAWRKSSIHAEGAVMRVGLPDGLIEGVYKDIDSDGALVIGVGNETRRIAAGAVLPQPGG
ncbi:MAG: biotin--[acetyl-CoA-carboxylase] ligase [Parvularculaceae bacterium]|nr:biotin--[acetyl-CoA-carboxylase] ligase [Parvularculaceae bacterium]